MAGDTRTLKVVVTGDSSGAKRALRETRTEADQTGGAFSRLSSSMVEWGSKGVLALGAAAAAATVMGIKSASGSEQARIGFTNMLGSAEKADKMLQQLRDFADKTPFDLPGLTDSAQTLMAMGFAAKDVIPTLRAAGDAAAGMGKGAESVSAITRALGQMNVKGKVSGEELMQLHEQGVPALKILADSYGLNVTQMSKLVEKGGVLSSKALPLIVKGMEQGTKSTKGFGGMMSQQSTTVQGRWSTMVDKIRNGLGDLALKAFPLINAAMIAVTDGAEAFFKSLESGKVTGEGFTKWASTAAVRIKEFAQWLRTDGVVWAKRFWEALKTVVAVVKDVVTWLQEHKTLIIALATVYVTLIAAAKIHAGVMAVQRVLFAIQNGQLLVMASRIAVVRGAIAIWTAYIWLNNLATKAVMATTKLAAIGTAAWTAAQWLLNTALIANPIGLFIIAIVALVAAFVIAYKRSDTFRRIVNALAKDFVQGLKDMGKIAKWLWEEAIKPALRFITKAWTTLVGAIIEGAAAAFGWVPKLGPKLKEAAKKFGKFRDDVNASLDGLKDKKITVSATYSATAGGATLTAANFGKRHGLAKGGAIPNSWGTPGKDSVPALLMPREFVVRADGSNLGDAIAHFGGLRLAKGGVVPNISVPNSTGAVNDWAYDRTGRAALQRALNSFVNTLSSIGSGAAGSALARVRGAMPQGTYVTSTYRTPAQNRAVGGSPSSYHLDRNNPAVDVGGPTRLLDLLYGRLVAMGQWRELLWRTSGHWDHVHAAHAGGVVDSSWPSMPGWGYNERPARLKVGETVIPEGAGLVVLIEKLIVEGNVTSERELVNAITLGVRDGLLRHAGRNGGRTGLPGK